MKIPKCLKPPPLDLRKMLGQKYFKYYPKWWFDGDLPSLFWDGSPTRCFGSVVENLPSVMTVDDV